MHGEALAWSVKEKNGPSFHFTSREGPEKPAIICSSESTLNYSFLSQFCHFDRTGSCLPPYLYVGRVDMQIGEW